MERSKLPIILSHSPPCELADWAKDEPFIRYLTYDKEFLMTLSVNLGLPYSSDIEELCEFSMMSKGELLVNACKTNDVRVFKIVLGTYNISQDYILKAAIACIQNGNLELFRLLPQDNLDFDELLTESIVANNVQAVRMILDRGIRPDIDHFHYAVNADNVEIVGLVIEHKDSFQDEIDDYELIAARSAGVLKLVLDNFGADVVEIEGTIASGDFGVLDMLVQEGLATYDEILMYSSYVQDFDSMIYALDQGATNIEEVLVESALQGRNEVVSFLLENGAIQVQHALYEAIDDFGDIETIQLLVQYGAVIDDVAFRLARRRKTRGDPNIIDYLESADV